MLTDAEIRKAKPQKVRFKMYDTLGLYLSVQPNGKKFWRMRYVVMGREKLLSFGPFPEVTLASARVARDAARAELRTGADPSHTIQVKRALAASEDHRFETIARAWHEKNKAAWQSEKHRADVLGSLEAHIFPRIGKLPIREITEPMLVEALHEVSKKAPETAHRIRQRLSKVFRFAIVRQMADIDRAASIGDELPAIKKKSQPAILDLVELRKVLLDAEAVASHAVTKFANRLLALTAARPGELTGALWSEMHNLEGNDPTWRIPDHRMKMKLPHVFMLSRQAVEAIEALRALSGTCPYLFPNTRSAHRPISANAIGYLLNRAGYHHHHVPHGWRASFSTIMNEKFPQDRLVIDRMLAHVNKNAVEAAYNRSQHMERRRFLAQTWADMLLDGAMPAVELLRGPAR